MAGNLQVFPGGKGLNQAIAFKKAGVDVYFGGCIGEDGGLLRNALQKAGVNTEYLKETGTRTGQAIIQVDEEGRNAILVYPGANHAVTKEYIDLVLAAFGAGDYLLVQNEISELQYLIQKAARIGMKVILNPSPFTEDLREIDLNDVFCLILNETEASEWIRSERPLDLIPYAAEHSPSLMVMLTLGEQGSVCLCKGAVYRQEAFSVNVVDTTAAGDTFTGYFAAGLIRNEPLG